MTRHLSVSGAPFRPLSLSAVLLAGAIVPGVALAQSSGDITDKFGISLRLGLEFETEPDAALDLEDFASRLTWNDTLDTGTGLDVLAFIDLGYGLNQAVFTREAWLGVEADFGAIKGGTQFRAFYDTTSSFTDVGWWDTCYAAIGCARAPGVLKYENELSPTLRVIASATLTDTIFDDDEPLAGPDAGVAAGNENEFIEQLEAGAVADVGDLEVGGAFGVDLSGDTGFAIGAAARTALSEELDVSAMLQFASEDYNDIVTAGDGRVLNVPRAGENLVLASLAASAERVYGLLAIGDANDTVFGATAGYVYPLVGGSKIYAEVSGVDDGSDNSDFNLQARGVFVYHFGAEEAARRR